jgi:hypothetical protein
MRQHNHVNGIFIPLSPYKLRGASKKYSTELTNYQKGELKRGRPVKNWGHKFQETTSSVGTD